MGATLGAFDPGQMYEFRVAAVGLHGSRGFGVGTEPYPKEPTNPQPPTTPKNVTAAKWRLHQNGQVSVSISWAPPDHSDLPLEKYSVSKLMEI